MTDPGLALSQATAALREVAAGTKPAPLVTPAQATILADWLGHEWQHMQEWGYRTYAYDRALALAEAMLDGKTP